MAEVEKRLGLFAVEWHWTPEQVWRLSFREFCMYADIIDSIAEAHKKTAQKQRTTGRGRRHGR